MFNFKFIEDEINWDDPALLSAVKDIEKEKADKVVGYDYSTKKKNNNINNLDEFNRKEAIIEGGATIWARQTIESDIFYKKPDKWFKIWFYIINNVNHKDNKQFKRGECFMKQSWICEGTGATSDQVKKCLKWLCKSSMMGTTRSTRGTLLKIVNYSYFQHLNNYSHNVEALKKHEAEHFRSTTVNKNDKNIIIKKKILKEKKNVNFENLPEFWKKKIESVSNFERILACFYVFSGKDFRDEGEFLERIRRDMGNYGHSLQVISTKKDTVIIQVMANLSDKGEFNLNDCAAALSTNKGNQDNKISRINTELTNKIGI